MKVIKIYRKIALYAPPVISGVVSAIYPGGLLSLLVSVIWALNGLKFAIDYLAYCEANYEGADRYVIHLSRVFLVTSYSVGLFILAFSITNYFF